MNESTYNQLYKSITKAFPFTTKRQHITNEIQVSDLRFTPFLGMNTLLVRANALNEENNHHYNPILMFKNVHFHDQGNTELVVDGQHYHFDQLSKSNNHMLVRCSCEDLKWRFQHEDFVNKCLFSKDRKPYQPISDRGPVNPTSAIGFCKHLIKTVEMLTNQGVIS